MPTGLHAEVETEDTGLSVRMKLSIEPGQVALSTDEVSDWVTTVYEDARQILLQRVAVGETGDLRLIRQGHRHWVASPLDQEEPQPSPLMSVRATAARPLETETPSPAVVDAVLSPAPAVAPTAPRRHRQGIERTRQGSKVLAVLKDSDRPLDIKTVMRLSKLTDYMTRTTLKALVAVGLVTESEEEIGGRWGTKVVYTLKES
jgi:hypothetical protein